MKNLSKAGIEPPISDLMNDPLLQLIIQRDGLSKETVHQLMQGASDRLAKRKHAA